MTGLAVNRHLTPACARKKLVSVHGTENAPRASNRDRCWPCAVSRALETLQSGRLLRTSGLLVRRPRTSFNCRDSLSAINPELTHAIFA